MGLILEGDIGVDVSEKASSFELVTGDMELQHVATSVTVLVFVLSASVTNDAGTGVIIEAKGALHGVDGGDSCTEVHVAGDWWTPVVVEHRSPVARWKTSLWRKRLLQDEGGTRDLS